MFMAITNNGKVYAKTVGTSAVQLESDKVKPGRGIVQVKASLSNSATIYVGYSSGVTAGNEVTTDGWPLSPGEEQAFFTEDTDKVYAISTAASQKAYIKID